MKFELRAWRICFIAAILSALFLLIVELLRQRTFWCDEALVIVNIQRLGVGGVLASGPLYYSQQFPKLYLALIALFMHLPVSPYISARLLPLTFGISSMIIWAVVFYRHFAVKRFGHEAYAISTFLFLTNANALYYSFELKQYSADLF